MEELRRRQYLEAMGIQEWRLRRTPEPQPEAAKPATPPPPEIAGGGDSAVASAVAALDWDGLRAQVKQCRACVLSETRTQTVFGVGDVNADLLVVGEAPGADEDRQGEPFVGRAGKLLDAMLIAIGLRREQVFIANILKCRPPGNRDPHQDETLRCEPYLLRQLELVAPRAILSVGRISAQNLLGSAEAVGRLRGRVHTFGVLRTPLVVTYHPAYLLRSPEQKAKAWKDLQLVLRTLGSPLPGTAE